MLRGRESASFQYTAEWLAHPGRFPLDPALELRAGPFHTDRGFGCFRDAAPDRWGRQLVARARARDAAAAGRTPRRLTEADYLLGADDRTRHGALRFRDKPGGPFLAAPAAQSVPHLVQLSGLLRAADRLDSGAGGDDELALLLAPGSSLGGARPKASVLEDDGVLSMAKFPRGIDSWNVPRWEAVALALARTAGITVASSRLVVIEGRGVLVVHRFDRASGDRIPFLSAMSMLGATDGDGGSYPEIAEAIRRYGASPAADLKELWRRMVFTVLISNHDDHLRNHGFLRLEDGGWRLSPAYDLNPTPAEEGGRFLTTAIVAEDTRASLELALATARYYGLPLTDAREIVTEVEASVRRWREEATRLEVGRAEVDRMASAFEHSELRQAQGASAR